MGENLTPRSCRIWVVLKDALEGEGERNSKLLKVSEPFLILSLSVANLLWICDCFQFPSNTFPSCLKWPGLAAIAYNQKYFVHISNLKLSCLIFKNLFIKYLNFYDWIISLYMDCIFEIYIQRIKYLLYFWSPCIICQPYIYKQWAQ